MSGWQSKARIIQVERHAWLVVAGEALLPRYLIKYGPAVNRATHETHMLYRVLWWALDKDDRETVGWFDTYRAAEEYVRGEIERPDFRAPIVDPDRYGSAITVEEQRERWEAGLDPRTGKPRERDEAPPPV